MAFSIACTFLAFAERSVTTGCLPPPVRHLSFLSPGPADDEGRKTFPNSFDDFFSTFTSAFVWSSGVGRILLEVLLLVLWLWLLPLPLWLVSDEKAMRGGGRASGAASTGVAGPSDEGDSGCCTWSGLLDVWILS